ncbi:MAG: aldehyde dehydrogenase family protein [Myxococcales bacterium]|nr:aldehyde dehydrogenase family protein [Myxococcales bacterium]
MSDAAPLAAGPFAAGSVNPATLAPLPAWSPTPPEAVAGVVTAARRAQPGWAALAPSERERRIIRVGQALMERRAEISNLLWSETGRPPLESFMADLAVCVGYCKRAVAVSRKALAPEKVPLSSLEFPGKRATTYAVPRGVVGVIAPWNYPVANFMKSVLPALLAGNAVVMKPSEHTPRSGAWLAALLSEICGQGGDGALVGLVQGDGRVGAALIAGGVDSIVFTGSVSSGRKVALAAAERLIPCSVELGGKDAAIVLADCDLDRTVLGIAQWGLHNAGQNCAAIERVYVEDAIADAFIEKLGRVVARLRVATSDKDGESDLGPLQNAAQLAIVERHVTDAVSAGARVVCGGARVGPGYGFQATVLDRCSNDMTVVAEETFGPVIAVIRVPDAERAVAAANDSRYGLNGSVWTRDLARGESLAHRLEVGVAYVNNHAVAGTMPEIPWTGVRETGTGIAQSRHAYGSYVRRQTIFIDRHKDPEPYWMPSDGRSRAFAEALAGMQLGSLKSTVALLGHLKARVKALREAAR